MSPKYGVIAAEIYSPNLGDGVIYECLAYLFRKTSPDIQLVPLDISGRSSWSSPDPLAPWRLQLIAQAKQHTSRIYSYLNYTRLQYAFYRKLRSRWRKILERANLMVIGGGKLLMDNHLEFPTRLNQLSHLAIEISVPQYISAVGVGNKWSPFAKKLVSPLVQHANLISVRDTRSLQNLQTAFSTEQGKVTFDPAICAFQTYGKIAHTVDTQWIGINVINLHDANTFLAANNRLSKQKWLELWLQNIRAVSSQGFYVEIFTNGNLADARFAQQLYEKIQSQGISNCRLAPRPTLPIDLIKLIVRYQAVIACRLHTCVIATSYQISSIGLVWDEKIASFYQAIDRPNHAIQLVLYQPENVVERLTEAMQNKLEIATLQRCMDEALANASLILDSR